MGPTSKGKGKEREEEGRGGKRRKRKGRRGEKKGGRRGDSSLTQIPGSAPFPVKLREDLVKLFLVYFLVVLLSTPTYHVLVNKDEFNHRFSR